MQDFRMETFLAVCRTMNYTRAAKELGLTQPAVSQHIRYLEKVYGVELFVQNGKKIALTAAGEILRNAVLTMKHDEIHMKKRMQQAAGGEREYFFWGSGHGEPGVGCLAGEWQPAGHCSGQRRRKLVRDAPARGHCRV